MQHAYHWLHKLNDVGACKTDPPFERNLLKETNKVMFKLLNEGLWNWFGGDGKHLNLSKLLSHRHGVFKHLNRGMMVDWHLPPPPTPLTKQGHCQACTVHYLSISSTILMQKIHKVNARVIQNEPNQYHRLTIDWKISLSITKIWSTPKSGECQKCIGIVWRFNR